MNEKPMSPEQLRQLQQMAKDIQSKPGAQCAYTPLGIRSAASQHLPHQIGGLKGTRFTHAGDPLQQLEEVVRRG